jgi:hypothetical protein
MIQEGVVLFRVEHLEKRACRIPVDAASNLVYLINEDERILRTDAFESLNDLTRKGTGTLASVRAQG